jgi:osmotically-inducible protein OsmY
MTPVGWSSELPWHSIRDTRLKHLEDVEIAQDGGTVMLQGSVADSSTVKHMTRVAAAVDGVKSVDTSQLKALNPR